MPSKPVPFRKEFCFTQEHLEHLDAVIKLLGRSPGGLTAHEVDVVADSLTRLRSSIKVEALRQKAQAGLREVTPVPFRDFNARERGR